MKLFKLNHEYFTFISGALISLAISLMFEAFKSTKCIEIVYSVGATIAMTISSILCFVLATRTKTLQEEFKENIATEELLGHTGKDAKNYAWNKTIHIKEGSKKLNSVSVGVILLTVFTILTCIGSMILYYFFIGGN